MLVNVAHRDLSETRVGTQRRGQTRSKEGMPTQIGEKIRIAADRHAREQCAQRSKQCNLTFGLRHIGLCTGSLGVDRQRKDLERFTVDFAGGEARHAVEQFEVPRHHVRRQLRLQGFAQLARECGRRRCVAHQVSNQLINARLVAQQDGHSAHARLLRQQRFNLAQLDAKATNFYLIIGTPQALHLPIMVDSGKVAGSIQARIVIAGGPRVRQEFFLGQVRPSQITLGQTGANNAQLADFTTRQQAGRQAAPDRRVIGDDQQPVIG